MGNAYATNDAKVISEMLEGETIIINLESGNYYSVNATGSAVWNLVKARAGVDAMVMALMRAHEVEEREATESVRTFLGVLLGDGLIVEIEDAPASVEADETPSVRAAFVAPAVQKYDDMQQMLLADPIHDVDERGWPILKS